MRRNKTMNFNEYYINASKNTNQDEVDKILSKDYLDTKDVEKLVVLLQSYVCREVKKWLLNAKQYSIDPMDLVQAGNIGVIKAIQKCKLTGITKNKFYGYLKRYVHSYIELEFYKWTCCKRYTYRKLINIKKTKNPKMVFDLNPVISLDSEIYINKNGEKITISDVIADNNTVDESLDCDLLMNTILEKLPDNSLRLHCYSAIISK